MEKCGVLVIGNALVDNIKMIENYPKQTHLTSITSLQKNVGGNVCNVLINLAVMAPELPLRGVSMLGDDSDGEFILSKLTRHGIDVCNFGEHPEYNTSFTDVMTSSDSGSRTFFFYPGANAELSLDRILSIEAKEKFVQIGYLGLLPKLEIMRTKQKSFFSDALEYFLDQGSQTVLDLVSKEFDANLQEVFFSCLPYTSYLLINEIEAGNICSKDVRDNNGNLIIDTVLDLAKKFIQHGIREAVVIHCSERAIYVDKNGLTINTPSFHISVENIQGTVGAGDAFTAGFLYGMHQSYKAELAIKLGHAAARFNLCSLSSTDGAVTIDTLMAFVHNNYETY